MLLVPAILALWWVNGLHSQSRDSLSPLIADYGAYRKSVDLFSDRQFGDVVHELRPVWTTSPPSPLRGRSALLGAKAHLELREPTAALLLLTRYKDELPQPAGLIVLANAAGQSGDAAGSAAYYQRVFYEYPQSEEAVEAEAALATLQAQLGDSYPPPMPQARFDRATRLMRSGAAARARREYEDMAGLLGGRERDLALVRARTGDYRALSLLTVGDKSADSERLLLMHSAARKAEMYAEAEAAVRQLSKLHPTSPERLEALISLGNTHLVKNETSRYEPVFRECFQAFPSNPRAGYCHWKVTWNQYLQRLPDADGMLREHLASYPASEKRSAALYFLRRYPEILESHPHSYYATLARSKTARPMLTPARSPLDFSIGPNLQKRIERARLLEQAGLPEWAEIELKYAADHEGQSFPAALELASSAHRRGAYHQGIRYIKSVAPNYLNVPLESAPPRFWQAAFPLAYRDSLETHSKARSLDPFMVAALIRQESEFDPRAVSSAKAYGLTQVLPSTGRQLSRRVGITGFTASMLFIPDTNLKLGTLYLRTLLDLHGGSWERTLASYNAGKSRVDAWQTWGEFREPAEFIETIPFTETRNYVQIVLRNAAIYRQLYGGAPNGGSAGD